MLAVLARIHSLLNEQTLASFQSHSSYITGSLVCCTTSMFFQSNWSILTALHGRTWIFIMIYTFVPTFPLAGRQLALNQHNNHVFHTHFQWTVSPSWSEACRSALPIQMIQMPCMICVMSSQKNFPPPDMFCCNEVSSKFEYRWVTAQVDRPFPHCKPG